MSELAMELRRTLPGIGAEHFGGDNLAIFLASQFETGDEDNEPDESGTWEQQAIDRADAVMDAIHAHYADRIQILEAGLVHAVEIVRAALSKAEGRE